MQLLLSRYPSLGRFAVQAALALSAAWLVLNAPFPINLAIFPALAVFVGTLISPVILPWLLVASVPAQDVIAASFGPASLTATRGAVLLAVAIVAILAASGRIRPRGHRLVGVLAIYVAVMVLSVRNAVDFSAAAGEIYRWTVALFALWMTVQLVRTRRQALVFFGAFAVAAAGLGAIGAIQTVFGIGPASFALGAFTRAYGTFGMPNSYAAYLEMTALPLLPVAFWAAARFWDQLAIYRRERLRGFVASRQARRSVVVFGALALLFAGGFAGGLAGIIVSFSRGGWLATVGALGVMALFLGRRVAFLTAGSMLVLLIVLSTNVLETAPDAVQDRYRQIRDQLTIFDSREVRLTPENFAAVERMAHWQTGIAMWQAHPILGVGVGNFDDRFREFAVHPRLIHSRGHAHNYFIHVLAETGIAGLLAYLTLLTVGVLTSLRAWTAPDSLARAIGIGAIGMTAALVLHGMVENLHVLNISVQITVVWGLAIVAQSWVGHGESARETRRGAARVHDEHGA